MNDPDRTSLPSKLPKTISVSFIIKSSLHFTIILCNSVLRFGSNSQGSAPRTTRINSVHVYRTHQEGASERFGVEAIGVTKVATDDSDTHQRVSVLPVCFGRDITFCSIQQNWNSGTCCDHTTARTNSACTALSSGPQSVKHSSSRVLFSTPRPLPPLAI